LIGQEVIDNRNSVGEYSQLIEPLLNNYIVFGKTKDWIVLKKNSKAIAQHIVCDSEIKDSSFLRVSMRPLETFNWVIYKLGTALFKAPQFKSDIRCGNQKISNRVYLGDLKDGLYMSDLAITDFLAKELSGSHQKIEAPCTGQALFDRSVWSLPIVGDQPLTIEYCRRVSDL
jgi:hypothetical protein